MKQNDCKSPSPCQLAVYAIRSLPQDLFAHFELSDNDLRRPRLRRARLAILQMLQILNAESAIELAAEMVVKFDLETLVGLGVWSAQFNSDSSPDEMDSEISRLEKAAVSMYRVAIRESVLRQHRDEFEKALPPGAIRELDLDVEEMDEFRPVAR